jgi:hypothetical protein
MREVNIWFEIHKLFKFVWSNEECLQQWKESVIYAFINCVINWLKIIKVRHLLTTYKMLDLK